MSDRDPVSADGEDPASPEAADMPPGGPAEVTVCVPPVLPADVPPGVSPVLPAPEDLLGRRIAAAVVDMAGLALAAVIISVATGQYDTSGGGFIIALGPSETGILLAVTFLYFFVLEASTGQTLGKLLLDVRVRHVGGTRASVWAVAVRTLLRIVDWLPLLYLAGFITVLVTGARRQRIGDLAARTVLARAGRPAHSRSLALLPLAGVLLTAIVVPLALPSGARTYHDHGVWFAYPARWFVETPHQSKGTGSPLWLTSVGPHTPHDVVVVEAFRLKIPVTAQNIDTFVPEMAEVIERTGAGTIQGNPQKVTMGGLPAVLFDINGTAGGSPVRAELVFAFHGTTEYFVNCQTTHAEAGQVQQACNQLISTFHLG